MEQPKKVVNVAAQDGPSLSVVGDTYRLVVTGKQTGGAYAVIDMLVPPGGGPGPHQHPGFHETFHVLEGEVRVDFESESFTARQGAFVGVPKGGGVHRFQNVSGSLARLWCVVIPAGLDDFFLEIGQPVAAGTFLPPPTMTPDEQQRLQTIAEKYGQQLAPPNYFDR
ncbi:MAG: cupin domain-containing protein [Ferruginibacter sp.]|nr:cupin domain-containing protein [Cytophagales bacterium]